MISYRRKILCSSKVSKITVPFFLVQCVKNYKRQRFKSIFYKTEEEKCHREKYKIISIICPSTLNLCTQTEPFLIILTFLPHSSFHFSKRAVQNRHPSNCRGAWSVCLLLTEVGSCAVASSFCHCVFKRKILKHIIVSNTQFNILKLYLFTYGTFLYVFYMILKINGDYFLNESKKLTR